MDKVRKLVRQIRRAKEANLRALEQQRIRKSEPKLTISVMQSQKEGIWEDKWTVMVYWDYELTQNLGSGLVGVGRAGVILSEEFDTVEKASARFKEIMLMPYNLEDDMKFIKYSDRALFIKKGEMIVDYNFLTDQKLI